MSKKGVLLSPVPSTTRVPSTPPNKLPKQGTKYSRLKHELSLAIQNASAHTVCSVTALNDTDFPPIGNY